MPSATGPMDTASRPAAPVRSNSAEATTPAVDFNTCTGAISAERNAGCTAFTALTAVLAALTVASAAAAGTAAAAVAAVFAAAVDEALAVVTAAEATAGAATTAGCHERLLRLALMRGTVAWSVKATEALILPSCAAFALVAAISALSRLICSSPSTTTLIRASDAMSATARSIRFLRRHALRVRALFLLPLGFPLHQSAELRDAQRVPR